MQELKSEWPTRISRAAIFAGILLIPMTGCDRLLDVTIPGQIAESELDNPALAATMVAGALGEFECAFNRMVISTGILTGEYITSGIFIGLNSWGWRGDVEIRSNAGSCPDSRTTANYGFYTPLQTARFLADDTFRRIGEFSDAEVPGKTKMQAQLATYSGYGHILLGEAFCEMAIDQGPLMTRDEVFAIAVERFTAGIERAQAAQDVDLHNLALLGRARARLNLGQGAEAATDAAQIPEGFVWYVENSAITPRRENRVWHYNHLNEFSSVGPDWRDLEVDGVPDPRVPVVYTGDFGSDGITPQWNQLKFTSPSSPIRLASWHEAQLIIAEGRGGQEAIDAMNRVRSSYDLPHLDPNEIDDILEAVLEERRREFFSEGGHRHNDMIRHNIPFPSGFNHKNQILQDYDCMPLPDVERLNNPNIP